MCDKRQCLVELVCIVLLLQCLISFLCLFCFCVLFCICFCVFFSVLCLFLFCLCNVSLRKKKKQINTFINIKITQTRCTSMQNVYTIQNKLSKQRVCFSCLISFLFVFVFCLCLFCVCFYVCLLFCYVLVLFCLAKKEEQQRKEK